jgi:MFS family permease
VSTRPEKASPPSDESTSRTHFVDLSPFRRSPAFFRLWLGGLIAGIGGQMTIIAVGLHIYDITGSTTAVSLVGVFALVPMIFAGVYGGVLADSFDRRTVVIVAEFLAWGSTVGLALLAWNHIDELWMFYALTTVTAVATTVVGATRSAIVPRLLTPDLLPAAAALGGISFGVQVTLGPALAGVLVATVGFQWTYTVDVVLFIAAFTGVVTLPRIIPEGGSRRAGFAAVWEGLAFLKRAPNIRMSFLIDIVAMTFGMPRVVFPAVGALLIGGGAITVGILSAAFAVGALLSSVFSGRLGHVRRQGRAISRAVAVYGAFIAAFGLVLLVMDHGPLEGITSAFEDANLPALALASIALAGAGASDNVSSIFRQTLLQSAVPDVMRGRIQGVFTVVVTGGPRLGDAYVGLAAATALLWLPPLLGGAIVVVFSLAALRLHRSLRDYDALNPMP